MTILDRLPIYDKPTLIDVHGEVVQVFRNQAIVWSSLTEAPPPGSRLDPRPETRLAGHLAPS
jgi:hypothetical protein